MKTEKKKKYIILPRVKKTGYIFQTLKKNIKKKKNDIKKAKKNKKTPKTVVTGLFMPQFTILSSLIHLQYRELTEQGGQITLENSNSTCTKKVHFRWFSISVSHGSDST